MERAFRVGDWLVEPHRYLLVRAGHEVRIDPKVMQVLVCLANDAEEVVSKEKIIETVWEDTFVTDEVLTNAIWELRKAMGDDAKDPRFIQTVPRKGYRLIAPVSFGVEEAESTVPSADAEPIRPAAAKRRWLSATLFFLVAAALSTFAFLQMRRGGEIEAPVPEALAARKMIVVLPFEHLGSPEEEHFTSGITMEIHSRLASVGSLGVISRTSAVQYEPQGKTLQQIGEDLGVDYVVEGTVRWEEPSVGPPRVRVTTQLVQVANDTALWSGRYERDTNQVFQVQAEIAEDTIRGLDQELLEPGQAIQSRPTANVEAYQAYLRGLDFWYNDLFFPDSVFNAVEMFEQATELDPAFVPAYARLSRAHAVLHHIDLGPLNERRTRAKQALDRALELGPDLPETRLALGYYRYHVTRDFNRALEEFRVAEAALPNDTEVLQAIGTILRRHGRFDEAAAKFEKALHLNPRAVDPAFRLARTLACLRRYQEAVRYFDHSISLFPEQTDAYFLKAEALWHLEGSTQKARASLEAMPEQDEPISVLFWWAIEVFDKNYQGALKRLSSSRFEFFDFYPKAYLEGKTYFLMGEVDRANAFFETARLRLEEKLKEPTAWPFYRMTLGLVYAHLGRKEEAIRLGLQAVEMLPVTKDAVSGPPLVVDLAQLYTIVGEHDAALDQIEYLLSIPAGRFMSVPLLQIDPRWDPLRDHPRFQKLLEDYEKEADR